MTRKFLNKKIVFIGNIALLTIFQYFVRIACTASAVKTLLALPEPLLELVEILEEIQCFI
jgi:energy-coupling factor transporter transmembrane protein EcfT